MSTYISTYIYLHISAHTCYVLYIQCIYIYIYMYTYKYLFVLICAATCRTRAFASCPSRSADAEIFRCCTPPLCALNLERPRPSAPSTPRFGGLRWDYHLQLGTGRRRSAGVLACVGHPHHPPHRRAGAQMRPLCSRFPRGSASSRS